MNQGEVLLDDEPKVVFREYKKLEQGGLAAPAVVYIMAKCREVGLDVDPDVTNIEEAREEILLALGRM